MGSVITNRDRDCFSCRIISGSGLLGIGLYLGYQSRINKTVFGRLALLNLGIGFSALGVARIFEFPPFKDKFSAQRT